MSPVKVLYVAGASRSGTTIFDRLLGHVPGLISVGEAAFLWSRGLQEGWICGCGEPVNQCPFWCKVVDRTQAQVGPIDSEEMIAALHIAGKTRAVPLYLLPQARRWLLTRFQPQLLVLEQLYHAIAWAGSAQVIVDSSKNAGYGMLLNSIGGIELSCVHLVRDPRAVAHSWSRTKHGPGRPNGEPLPKKSALRSSLEWLRFTVGADVLVARAAGGGIRIRYEDFTAQPDRTLRKALSLVGKENDDLDFLKDAHAHLGSTHSVSGNPDRLSQVGEVDIRPRVDWRHKLSVRDRLIVRALTWPQMLRYGYSWHSDIEPESVSTASGED